MEAATGFEPVIRVLQTRALPLGYAAVIHGAEDEVRTRDPTLARWCSTTELLPQNGWGTRIRT